MTVSTLRDNEKKPKTLVVSLRRIPVETIKGRITVWHRGGQIKESTNY